MKNIFITGASSGIGYTTCSFFLGKGYRVFGTVRSQQDSERLTEKFDKNFYPIRMDLTLPDSIERAKNQVAEILKGGSLDVLVNNAGIAVYGPLLYLEMKEIRHQFEVNFFGLIKTIQVFYPLLKTQSDEGKQPGRIINISSVSGLVSSPFLSPYCSSKFALESLSDSLRRELSLFDQKVIVIEPGPIKTSIWEKAKEDPKDYSNTPYREVFKLKDKMVNSSEKQAIDPIQVAKKIHHASTTKSPKTRYIVTRNKWRIWLFSRLIPDKWIDRLYLKAFKEQKFRP